MGIRGKAAEVALGPGLGSPQAAGCLGSASGCGSVLAVGGVASCTPRLKHKQCLMCCAGASVLAAECVYANNVRWRLGVYARVAVAVDTRLCILREGRLYVVTALRGRVMCCST